MDKTTERLSEALSSNLVEQNFDCLTSVQSAVLAADAARRDMFVQSPTGSGKTIAFGLTAVGALAPGEGGGEERGRFVVVIVPTRELAVQVNLVLQRLYRGTDLAPVLCLPRAGGPVPAVPVPKACDVFITTPGRFGEMTGAGALSLDGCACVVLDEADELLSGDYHEDLEAVLSRQAGDPWRIHLYTATITPALDGVVSGLLVDPARVDCSDEAMRLPNVDIQAISCTQMERDRVIGSLLRVHHPERAIVYCNRRDEAARLSAKLYRRGFTVVNLTGALGSEQRLGAVERFGKGHARVCVATDVAARGLDFDGLELIVHAGVPDSPELLLHRSGRAGRRNARGRAVLVCLPEEKPKAERLVRRVNREIDWIAQPRARCIKEADKRKVLHDPIFSTEPGEEDRTLAELISRSFTPEAITHACARLWRNAQPMARDLERQVAPKHQGEGWLWLEMSIGERTRADMAEILRMICTAAGVGKTEIGRIHVGNGTARFELPKDLAERVLENQKGEERWHIWRV
ncbi:DEAD/DEAH box helicase [Amaricoccus macauensis]|uniref:DEAD/DEAH box helicase n=1 Tax=Amaricoccus macauensis TaxID=57001 RepID=UPI003C79A31A